MTPLPNRFPILRAAAIGALALLVAMMALVHPASAEGDAASCATGGTVPDEASTGLVADCDALLAVQDTLAGSATLNWSVDSSIADWEGVFLEGSPLRVTGLRLARAQLIDVILPLPGEVSSNYLNGEIPPELGRLSNLQELDLSFNQLSGEIPFQLADLASLEVLALKGNQLLTGCIPEGLRDVASNDLEDLGLPFCDVLLSGLAISPGTLTPPFDSYHTDYTTVVGQSRVTVTPANDHNASFQFLDRNYAVLADADGSLGGHQVDLGAGVTTVRIRVISPDSRATHTYTIVDLAGRYDANDDGAIDRDEVLDAIDDYFDYDDRITKDEVLEIIGLYLFSAPPTPTPVSTPVPRLSLLDLAQSSAWYQASLEGAGTSIRAARALILLQKIDEHHPELAKVVAGWTWFFDEDLVAREVNVIEYLAALDEEAPRLADLVVKFPWIADGILKEEASAVGYLYELALHQGMADLAVELTTLPWILDGVTVAEAEYGLGALRGLAIAGEIGTTIDESEAIDLARRIAGLSWVTDGITEGEWEGMWFLWGLARFDIEFAKEIVDQSWVTDVRTLSRQVRVSLERLGFEEMALSKLGNQPWFADGLNDAEAALVTTLYSVAGRIQTGYNNYRRIPELYDDLLENHHIQHKTVSLTLAGDVNIWVIESATPPAEEDLLTVIAETARIVEGLLGIPFPTTDIILLVLPSGHGIRGSHMKTHMMLIRHAGKDVPVPFIPHETAHYYFELGPRWFREGGAQFIEGYINDQMGVADLADRRVWVSEKALPDMQWRPEP